MRMQDHVFMGQITSESAWVFYFQQVTFPWHISIHAASTAISPCGACTQKAVFLNTEIPIVTRLERTARADQLDYMEVNRLYRRDRAMLWKNVAERSTWFDTTFTQSVRDELVGVPAAVVVEAAVEREKCLPITH